MQQRRGEIRWAKLSPVLGHEQAGHRPVLIVSDDRYMATRGLCIVFPLTSNPRLMPPIAIELHSVTGRRSFALPGQIRALSSTRLGECLAVATATEMAACLSALLHLCGQPPEPRGDNDG